MNKKTLDRVVLTTLFLSMFICAVFLFFKFVTFFIAEANGLWILPGAAIGVAGLLLVIKKVTGGRVDPSVPLIWITLP